MNLRESVEEVLKAHIREMVDDVVRVIINKLESDNDK